MKKLFIFAPTLLLLLFSCHVEQNQSQGREARCTFYATIGEDLTKVYADENLRLLWNADDRISIFNKTTYNYQFVFTGEDGDNAGGFDEIPPTGFITGSNLDNVYAVYPYASGNRINNAGSLITLTLPAEQVYKEHSFGIGANTMVAATDGSFLAFKNVGGYLVLRLYGDDVSVSRVTLQGNNGEKIAGKAKVSVGIGQLPSVTMDGAATESVSVVCDPPVQIGSSATDYTEFWFVLPPVTFANGFTITVEDTLGGSFVKSTSKSFTITRSTRESMSALKVAIDYENVLVSFADANFKAYCVENFDTNGDGEISVAEAREVTAINVYNKNITSLAGIEAFTSLTYLYCQSNQLTSLDVSKNTALTTLSCDSNQLNALDVSNNTALTYLGCGSNPLTSLDVSNNTALIELSCNSNQLSALDVSKNTALITLDCQSNQLTSLDVSNNTALKILSCYSNQLTSLDVSNNTALITLWCDSNQLTALDVGNCTALAWLQCASNQLTSLDVSKNTALKYLHCHHNQLTALDVSKNTALTELFCYSNQLTALDVSNNTALTYLGCGSNQLTSLDVSNNTALKYLHCDSNQLTALDVSKNTALRSLDCDSNQLTSLDVSNNPSLQWLKCVDNPNLAELWLKTGQEISTLEYDSSITTIYRKD